MDLNLPVTTLHRHDLVHVNVFPKRPAKMIEGMEQCSCVLEKCY